jgi:PKD repeat protein
MKSVLMVVGLVICLFMAGTASAANEGLLVVNSTPSAANIYVNGGGYLFHPFGVTNSTFGLAPGNYTVFIEKAGYATWRSDAFIPNVTIMTGNTTNLESLVGMPIILSPLPPTTGTLMVMSEPVGAEVHIEQLAQGISLGTTPFSYSGIPAGTYQVVLTYPGYQPYSATVVVPAGQTTSLYGIMTKVPTTGFVDFRTVPQGASIALNGALTSFNTNTVIEIPPGYYNYTLSLAGRLPATGNFTLTTAHTQQNPLQVWRELALVPETQDVVFDSNPEGAEIWIDGNDTGNQTQHMLTIERALHLVTLKKPCYQDATFSINLTQVPTGLFSYPTVNLVPMNVNICNTVNGTITPANGDPCPVYGQNKTYFINSSYGYHVKSVTFDGQTVFTNGQPRNTTFTTPIITKTADLCAVFELNQYPLMVVTNPASIGGSVQWNYNGPDFTDTNKTFLVKHGDKVTFTINGYSDQGKPYFFDRIFWNGTPNLLPGSFGQYTWTSPVVQGDSVMMVNFTQGQYTVTASATAGGTITPNGTIWVIQNSTLCFNATPLSTYLLASVTANGAAMTADPVSGLYCLYNISQNYDVLATFSPRTVNITATAGPGGNITPNGTVPVVFNGTACFNVTPDYCYKIKNVTLDYQQPITPDATTGQYCVYNVTVPHIVNATFEKIQYNVTAIAGTGGSIKAAGLVNGSMMANCGDTVCFNVTPDYCYETVLLNWTVGQTKSYYPYPSTTTNCWSITGNSTLTATFAKKVVNITVNSNYGGTVTAPNMTGNKVRADCGTQVCFTITPLPCYKIVNVTLDGVAFASPYCLTATKDQVLNVTFAQQTFNVTATWNTGGNVTAPGLVNGKETVPCGSNLCFNVTPDACYFTKSVTLNGTPFAYPYCANNITADQNLVAVFEKIKYTIWTIAGPGIVMTPVNASVPCGDCGNVTITPQSNFWIGSVTVNGIAQPIQDPTKPMKVNICPVLKNYTITAKIAPPVAEFAGKPETNCDAAIGDTRYGLTINPGMTVHFTDKSSGASSWLWDLGNGQQALVQNATTVYNDLGTYNVKLTVFNPEGTSNVTKNGYITVTQNPIIGFTAVPESGEAGADGLTVKFEGCFLSNYGMKSDPWYSFNFGDGSPGVIGKSAVHTYQYPGTYPVTFTVKNIYGTTTATKNIKVGGKPEASFDFMPMTGNAPVVLSFRDTSSGFPTSRLWSFGDMYFTEDEAPTHLYYQAGTYNVTLRVENTYGADSTYQYVTIH